MENREEETTETKVEQTGGFPKKTLFLIIFLIFVASLLSAVALYINNAPKLPVPTPTPVQVVAETVLTVSSAPIKQASASAYKTDVIIDTGKNKVTKAQIELSFDPNLITNVDIIPGQFFDKGRVLLKNIDSANGRISFAISQSPDQNGVSGNGVLATILFYKTNSLPLGKQIAINFEPKTQVSALDTSESVLKTTIGALFTLSKAPISSGSAALNQQASNSAH